jgi:hypothetical protein
MKYLLFIFLLATAVISCNEPVVSPSDWVPQQIIKVALDGPSQEMESMINAIESVDLIPLEYDSTFILSGMPQVRVTADRIYLFDERQCQFWGFSRAGKYLFHINQRGSGPKEYIQPRTISLLGDSLLVVFDQGRGDLLYFDKSGQYRHTKKIHYPAQDIAVLNDSLFVAYSCFPSFFGYNKNTVKLLDSTGKDYKTFLPLPKWIQNTKRQSTSGSYFFYHDSSPLLTLPWSSNIFTITPDTVYCKYYIDFGKHTLPENLLVTYQKDIDDYISEIIKQSKNNDWVWSIDYCQESSNYLFFWSVKGYDIYYTLFNKQTHEVSSSAYQSLIPEWGLIFKPLLYAYEDIFYTMTPVHQIKYLMMLEGIDNPRILKFQHQYSAYIENIGHELDDDDFVLLAFTMK